ncbi:MAG: aspartate/tyrosine/aromatic aminotransferase [Rhabdochlamydiaceae bacterium]|nr:aspartate/tyrosine/aromatic aminotransferase [Rhabdochlamydiaceae bacterium]
MGDSFFEHVTEAPADAIFKLTGAFMEDPRSHKVNLSVGVYRDEHLLTPILKSVKSAEKYLLDNETTKDYLPISGDAQFIKETGRLIFGDAYDARICGMQVPGGTGGLRIGADFVKQEVSDTIGLPDPTWPNHPGIFKQSGYKIHAFPYYNIKNNRLDMEGLFEALQKAQPGSVILFHACCHNPTGADLNADEWSRVAKIMKQKKLLPFFDFAYQGFGKGLEEDALAIRIFVKELLECVVVSSYSKNFGLYSERVGALFVVTQNEKSAQHVLSKLKTFARTFYSNPPRHGAAIVSHILSNRELKKEWMKEVDVMRHRIDHLRKEFVLALQAGQKKRDFSYLQHRFGMFCFLGLEQEKVQRLREEYGIYMADGGRINLAGLSQQNFNYVIQSMIAVV